ncbi:Uncharacterised protein [Mycobacterium xenopi]|uniref:Uncharacterized protein n=1 Tax=Mycobacterium xenopi TaxID=1789 RepID=A0AAD1H1H4_MYCXE|nr:hypothetical protein MYXE_23050 [Mycobacterium xenopi]SPX78390.1 Uncharacterised protein [Mycobacterium xenopi]
MKTHPRKRQETPYRPAFAMADDKKTVHTFLKSRLDFRTANFGRSCELVR